MSNRRKFIVPLSLGFLGMFVCHILILTGFGLGFRFPIYFIAYPVVYPLSAAILTLNDSKHWLTNAIFINALPLFYWYFLLWSDGRVSYEAALDWQASSGMLLIMPLTIGLSLAVAFAVSRHKQNADASANVTGRA